MSNRHWILRTVLLLFLSLLIACDNDDPVGAGAGGGSGAAGVRVAPTNSARYLVMLDRETQPTSLCAESLPQLTQGYGDKAMLLMRGLFCVNQEVEIAVCPYGQREDFVATEEEPCEGLATINSQNLQEHINSAQQIWMGYVVDQDITMGERQVLITEIDEGMISFNFEGGVFGVFYEMIYEDFQSLQRINQNRTDLFSEIYVRLDQSLLTDYETQYLLFDRREGCGISSAVMNNPSPEVMAFWDYEFQRESIVEYRDCVMNQYFTVDRMMEYIINDNYAALRRFARAENVNEWSRRTTQIGLDNITTLGLSPLMVAAILNDEEAIEILTNVPGIDLNFVSPVLGVHYDTYINNRGYFYGNLASWQGGYRSSGNWAGGSAPSGWGGASLGSGSPSGGPDGDTVVVTGPAVDVPEAVERRQEPPQQECADCTAIMAAIKRDECSSITAIVEGGQESINGTNAAGDTALDFSARYNFACYNELMANKFDIRLSPDFLGRFLRSFNLDRLNRVHADIWNDFSAEDKAIHLRRLLNLPSTLGSTQEPVDVTIEQIQDVSSYVNISEQEAIEIVSGDLLPLKNASVSGWNVIKALNLNPNRFVTSEGLTVFDLYLRERNEDCQVLCSGLTPFGDKVAELLEVEPSWLTEWVNGQSFYGYNPFVLSTIYGERNLLLVMKTIPGYEVDVVDQKTGFTAIQWAFAQTGQRDMCIPAYDSARWDRGRSPLYCDWISVFRENIFVRDLVASGAELPDLGVARETQPAMQARFGEMLEEFRVISGDSANPTPFLEVVSQTRTQVMEE